ncbi:hypothetical protein EYF80_007200 [Liparis tanakae]|uniref:Uncharacterized protein n=1 Tax=Liparis tanakae TaxID=230148 RepID=A0A4Z2IZH3_9TELE|nr:hypothetical protein EYF80_007200 [Liparis tanakae]
MRSSVASITLTFPAMGQEARQPSGHRAGERRVPAVAAFTDKRRFLPDVFSLALSPPATGALLGFGCRETAIAGKPHRPTDYARRLKDLVHSACEMLRERLRCDAAPKTKHD